MKKAATIMVAVLVFSAWSTVLMAADGTESNWDLNLSFSAGSAADLLEVTIGTNQTADELLKPPHLPGQADTGNEANAYVRAYVVTSAARQAAKSIDTSNKVVWAIDVDAEKAGETVSVTIDDSNYVSKYYPFTLIIPGESEPVKEVKSSSAKTVDLFTSDGSVKRIYAVAGESRTFAAADSDTSKIIGMVDLPGVGLVAGSSVKLFADPCGSTSASKTATTDANGLYELDSISNGDYIVQLTKDYYLGTECSVSMTDGTVDTSGCGILYTGDLTNDGSINLFDIGVIKDHYGLTKGAEGWDDFVDVNADESINLYDLGEIKPGFGKQDATNCGS